jgi:hypothetical protein
MAIAGTRQPQMIEHYSHIRIEAKRVALDAIAKPASEGVSEAGVAQNWAQSSGVNPSVETIWNWHTCRSMILDRACNKLL